MADRVWLTMPLAGLKKSDLIALIRRIPGYSGVRVRSLTKPKLIQIIERARAKHHDPAAGQPRPAPPPPITAAEINDWLARGQPGGE